MRKTQQVLLCGLMIACTAASAQTHRCVSTEYHQIQLEQNPSFAETQANIESHTVNYINEGSDLRGGTISIPVVFHVIYNGAGENVPDATLQSQIDVLNEDFRMMNSDAGSVDPAFTSIQADANIEFCLATTDPAGNPTTGITRKSTSITEFDYTTNEMKFESSGGVDAWDRDEYLNIWVCDISSGILGYAQFPGGSASTDGVVLDFAYTGRTAWSDGPQAPYNLGRTGTHEVGHWLNLRHIWGDGGCGMDDAVSDTPISDGPNYGCPGTTTRCSSQDNTQNYMDYTDDACMVMFSGGQVTRMQALFSGGGARESLTTSGGCASSAVTCDFSTAPINTTSFVNFSNNEVTLRWDPIPESVACQVYIKTDPSGPAAGYRKKVTVVGSAPDSLLLPSGSLNNNYSPNYGWRVRCSCTMDNTEATPWSAHAFFSLEPTKMGDVQTGDIYPNPASTFLNVELHTAQPNDASIRIMDLTGRSLADQFYHVEEGSSTFRISTENLSPGMYLLDVNGQISKFQVAPQ